MAPAILSRFRTFSLPATLLLALTVAGCVTTSAVDSLEGVVPAGSPFSIALFKNYSYLAHSFRISGSSSGTPFDSDDTMSIGGPGADVADLANAFADKALRTSTGEQVLPENPIDNDSDSADMHQRLLQALDQGRDKAPDLAARAQADYDCWTMDAAVPAMARAADQCRRSLGRSLSQLESALNITQAPAPTSDATPPAPSASPGYTVFFDFDSWTLTAEDLTVLMQAIDAARQGRQSTIAVVGHTDTSGSADYNQHLSVRRADVVKETLVTMGARPEAIQVSGVGESDLAVATGDGVKEAKNRRTVITLVP